MRVSLAVFVLVLVLAGTLPGQTDSVCEREEARQFDFWIGEWKVEANGQIAGENSIVPILDGCVLQEMWRGVKGSAGSSLNFFNPSSGRWQQFWVWRNGTTLELEGEFSDGKMILAGDSTDRGGKIVSNRITWFANEDGTVRQLWEVSRDRGGTWQTVFDGLYSRKK